MAPFDGSALRAAASALRASSANLGALRVAELAGNLEQAARAADGAAAAHVAARLAAEHELVILRLQSMRKAA